MNLQQLFLIFKARYKIALFTMLLLTSATLAISLIVPPRYTAKTTVVVDTKSQGLLAETALITSGEMPSYLPTQVDIINSERVVQKVIKVLRIDESPAVRDKWLENTGGEGSMLTWLGDVLQNDMDAKPSRDSNVITISYVSPDPGFSSAVANAFAQAYIDTNIELKTEPAHEDAQWFLDQGKGLRENLEAAQAKLSNYQQKNGIVVTDERLDSETAKLADLSAQLTTIEFMTADARSKQRSGNSSGTLPEVTQNGMIQTLQTDIDRLEGKLQDAAGNIGKNHPQYQRMQAELSTLKERLAAETAHIASGFVTNEDVGKDKAGQVRQLMEAQKRRLLELRHQRDEANVLIGEVNNAQKAYDAVTQRFTQTNLESQAKQTNISVLTPATPPLKPSAPLPVLYTLAAAILSTFIGVGVAFLMEMFDRRIRTVEDIEYVVGLPVLARLSKQQSAPRLWMSKLRLKKPTTIEFSS